MIVKDIDAVVDYLHPLLKKLNIQDSLRDKKDVYAIEIPALDFLNLDNCKITVIRERLPNTTLCGQLLVRYRPEHAHFALGPEIMEISYTDLYYNLMFSKKDFEEHFDLILLFFPKCIYISEPTRFKNSLN